MFWSPPSPSLIHNKKFSDQHRRYVQKYDHLEAKFITVTYHIKAFSFFVVDWFWSVYWGPINNATLRKSPPFSIQENPRLIKSQTSYETFTSLFLQETIFLGINDVISILAIISIVGYEKKT